MFNWVGDIIIVFLEALCCQMFFDVFSNESHERNRRGLNFLSLLSLGILYYVASVLLSNSFILRQLAGIMITALVMKSFRNYKIRKAVLLAILFHALLDAIEYIAYMFMLLTISDAGGVGEREEYISAFIGVLDLLVLFLCIVFIRRIFRKKNKELIYDKEWIKISIIPIFTIVAIALILSSFNTISDLKQIKVLYGVSMGLVVMNFLVFFIMEDIATKGELLRERNVLEVQSENQLEMYKALNENFEKQKTEAHEFFNHIVCMQALLEDREYDDLKEYVNELTKTELGLVNVLDTNNTIVNAIINTKYREAVNKQIVFTFKVNDLSNIGISDKDLVVLLSNLLNNAIEACEKCSGKKVIKVKFEIEDDDIVLSVKNSFNESVIKTGDEFLTTKENDKELHGIGIKNSVKIIEKYGGFYSISSEQGEFCFSVIIPIG